MNINTIIDLLQDGLLIAGSEVSHLEDAGHKGEISKFRQDAKAAIIKLQSGRVRVEHENASAHFGPEG